MNRFITLILTVATVGVAALACSNNAPLPGDRTKPARVAKKQVKQAAQVTVSDTIAAMRYELYVDGVSEVFFYHNDASIKNSGFYIRNMGDNTGWNYTVNDEPVVPLSQLAADLNLSQYPDYDLDNEDTTRNRWIIIVEYLNGAKKTICVYTDASTAEGDKVVREKAEAVFKAIKFTDKDGKMMGEYTKSIYAGGKLVKEINYTQDGIVHGGRDYTQPNDMEYALPPKTY